MIHNQYLNEILYLIEKNYLDREIDNTDLDTIQSFSVSLTNKDKQKSKFELNYDYLTSIGFFAYPLRKPKVYWDKFNRSFRDSKFNKIFAVKSTLLEESINKEKDLILRFVEINQEFELVNIYDNIPYWIKNQDELQKLNNYEDYRNTFDTGLGKELDNNYDILTGEEKQINTRKVTITYKSNFEGFIPHDNTYIIFIPAIIEDCNDINNNRFTLMMRFAIKVGDVLSRIPDFSQTHYDTFQLCPPYQQGQTHC